MSATSHTRRTLLQALTVGAGAIPFSKLLPGDFLPLERAAYAADGSPKRFMIWMDPWGIHETTGWESWVRAGKTGTPGPRQGSGWSAKSASAVRDFTLVGMTTPLEPIKDQLVFFDALERLPVYYADQHAEGFAVATTASVKAANDLRPQGPSIDQHLADKIGKLVTPRLPSLAVGVHGMERRTETASWLAGGQPVQAIWDPYKAYATVFGGMMAAPEAGAKPDPALVNRALVRKSVLDNVAKDITAFQRRLGKEDRLRADAQLDAVRTLERRLASAPPGSVPAGGGPTAACGRPTQMAGLKIDAPENHEHLLRMQLDLVAAAFACDATRIAAVTAHTKRGNGMMYQPFMIQNESHGLSHDMRDRFVEVRRRHFEDLLAFCKKLQAIPEGAGTMLDNTLIFCVSDIGPGHTGILNPFMTIGGKNLGVDVGKYHILPRGVPHRLLLTSMLNAMGLPDEKFGDDEGPYDNSPQNRRRELEKGPLPGFLR